MREYLFRGKRTDNDEWVYGSPIFQDGYVLIRFWNGEEFEYEEYLVAPESVGEWTGLIDNNAKKIFEGDIVRCQERYDRPYSKNRKSKRHIGVVEYQVRSGKNFYNRETEEWNRHVDYAAEWIVKVKDYGKFVHGCWGDFWDCEVIGNVFDNADLLEGQ